MRIDVTVRRPDDPGVDLAVVGPPEVTLREVLPALLEAVGCPGAEPVCCDGAPVDVRLPVVAVLRPGSVITIGEPGTAPPRGSLFVQVVGGAAAGSVAELRGEMSIGRDESCELRLPDPNVSRRHARLEAGPSGVRVRDLGSTNGTSVDGRAAPCAEVGPDSLLRVGDTYLRVAPLGVPAHHPPGQAVEPIRLPRAPVRSPSARLQWLAALVPAVGGLVVGWAMHSMLFLLMGALMPVAALAGWAGDRWHARRGFRRELAAHEARAAQVRAAVERGLATEAKQRRSADPDPVALASVARSGGARLWSRDRASPDLLRVRVGLGPQPARLQVDDGSRVGPAGQVRDVPICIDLGRGPVAAYGPSCTDLARWWVMQLATYCSPDAVRLVPMIAHYAGWRWLRWLPRVETPERPERRIARLAQEVARRHEHGWDGPWIVLLVDREGASEIGGALDELLRAGAPVGLTALCLDPPDDRLASVCRTAVTAGDEGGSRIRIWKEHAPVVVEAVADGVDASWADAVARSLARRASGGTGEGAVPLGELLGPLDSAAMRRRWSTDRGSADAVIGRAGAEAFEVDLDRDGPHALVAGTTGAGKSELLRTWVAALAVAHPPTAVTFLLVDYKGGAAFGACERLPHVLGVVTDLDTGAVRRALASLDAELRRREGLFAACGVTDWAAYRATRPAEPLPRLILVVDEFASLATELPEFMQGLVSTARRGRSLGVHLILATQRPGGSVSPEIRANTALRIALRTTTASESLDVIDSPLAERIDPADRGSGYARRGTALIAFRASYAGASSGRTAEDVRVVALGPWRSLPAEAAPTGCPTDLDRIVAAVGVAARGQPPARRPWLAPLPPAIPRSALPTAAGGVPIALADLPDEQRQDACELNLAAGGSVLVVGGSGSGRSTALVTMGAAVAAQHGPAALELYAIAPTGSPLADLAVLPQMISCLDLDDVCLLERFLSLLTAELERRRQEPDRPLGLLLIDGWEELVAADEASGRCVALLLGAVRVAGSSGLTVVLSGDRGALTPRIAAAFPVRYVLPLTDPGDYPLAGIAPRAAPTRPTVGRAIRARDRVEVQFAHLGAAPTREEARRELAGIAARCRASSTRPENRPVRVRPLPRKVIYAELPGPGTGRLAVRLGVGGDAAEPVTADLATGRRRLLIAGPPRSGRTSVLRTIADQLPRDIRGVVAARPGSALGPVAAARGWPMLSPGEPAVSVAPPEVVLIDDLEQFRDSATAELLAVWTVQSGITIVAAGNTADVASDYRGLTAALRRSGCVLLLQPTPADGPLAGITLPRRPTLTTPGRGVLVPDPAWLEAGQPVEPIAIQVAML